MSEMLLKAVAEAKASEEQAAQIAQVLAVVQAVQVLQAQPQPAGCSCAHGPQNRTSWTPGRIAATTCSVCVCGTVLVAMFLAVAVVAIAVAVGGLVALWILREVKAQMAK